MKPSLLVNELHEFGDTTLMIDKKGITTSTKQIWHIPKFTRTQTRFLRWGLFTGHSTVSTLIHSIPNFGTNFKLMAAHTRPCFRSFLIVDQEETNRGRNCYRRDTLMSLIFLLLDLYHVNTEIETVKHQILNPWSSHLLNRLT